MGNEPIWLLIERMRRALADAARVSARVAERVKQLEESGDAPEASSGAGKQGAEPRPATEDEPE